MKKFSTLLLLLSLSPLMAQVGIGTTNPQSDLHVAGSTLVTEGFVMNNLAIVSPVEEDFQLITRVTSSLPVGEITVLDVDALNVAPVNVVNYSFTNINLDNLDDVDLQYDATKYVVGVANFRHVGDAIKKIPGGETFSIVLFQRKMVWRPRAK